MKLLAALRQHLAEHHDEPVPADLRAGLLRALDAIQSGADVRQAFGNGDHARGLAALRRAAELAAPGASPWVAAQALEIRVRAFRDRAWPRIRAGARGPVDEIEAALVAAFDCDDWPTSARRLYEHLR